MLVIPDEHDLLQRLAVLVDHRHEVADLDLGRLVDEHGLQRDDLGDTLDAIDGQAAEGVLDIWPVTCYDSRIT